MAYTKPDTAFLREFGQRVRKLRKAAKWTQEELAERSGLHHTYIGSIERGERNLALLNIRKVANAFGRTLSKFLGDL
jgi:transcriptional regulator with XRE-family HTH domain